MSGTVTVGVVTGAGAPWGVAAIFFAAPTASVALASRTTTPTIARRGNRVAIRRAMLRPSARNGLNSTPGAGKGDDAITRLRDDGEDPGRRLRAGQLERRRSVLPAERLAREALEPGLVLRVGRRRLELEMEVRPCGVAGRADEPDLRPRRERDAVDDGRVEDGEMAVRPRLAVLRANRHADAATRVGLVPGVQHDRVR